MWHDMSLMRTCGFPVASMWHVLGPIALTEEKCEDFKNIN